MINKIIRVENISLNLDEDESCLLKKISKSLSILPGEIISFKLVKKAIDARRKPKILFIYSVDIETKNTEKIFSLIQSIPNNKYRIKLVENYVYKVANLENTPKNPEKRPIIVGTGPAGLFAGLVLAMAGLKPLLIERGQDVDTRTRNVELFREKGELNPNSNVQFGEGGAGTFSDGKLYTLINDPRSKFIFEELVKAGAPEEILYDAKPHVGTDKLKVIVKNLRKKIISLGGEVKFNTCLNNLEIIKDQIIGIEVNNSKKIKTDNLVLAIGHSARDTYQMLYENKLNFEQKPFAIGLRIEHRTDLINKSQFSNACNNPKMPTASYKLVNHSEKNRSVFSFCMCPGGYVMAASSEIGRLTINGMSEYKQDSSMSNSALLVSILPKDFESDHPLAGIVFQRKREEKAFIAGGKNYNAPAQFVGDFLKNKSSFGKKLVYSTYKPGITLTSLNSCLPKYVLDSIKNALPQFDKKIKGFASPETLLIGIEARSSAAVRIIRDKETFQSNISGIYPTGEGAGYAGGITSAAIDGLKVAEKIIEKYI